jgi:hypothetical protein
MTGTGSYRRDANRRVETRDRGAHDLTRDRGREVRPYKTIPRTGKVAAAPKPKSTSVATDREFYRTMDFPSTILMYQAHLHRSTGRTAHITPYDIIPMELLGQPR